MESYKSFWKNYSNFNGTASRSEYWTAKLINLCILFFGAMPIIYIADYGAVSDDDVVFYAYCIVLAVFALATVIPSISITVRRLHDVNMSGLLLLLYLIPSLGGLVIFIFTLLPSNHKNNKWIIEPEEQYLVQ